MNNEPYYTRSAAKKAKVSVDSPSGNGVASATSAATTPPSSSKTPAAFCPRRRVPPDPKRYVALWEGSSPRDPSHHDTDVPSLSKILDELDLAEHQQRTRERIHALQRTIDECEKEIDELRRELDVRTVLPRLLDDDSDDVGDFWQHEVVRRRMHCDKALAWALVRAAQDPSICGDDDDDFGNEDEREKTSALPFSFQLMLWSDRRCPLRRDRQLLLASLDMGLHKFVSIRWTTQIANDREILIKIFEKCPWCLDKANVPASVLSDADLIRAFARSASVRRYRRRLEWSEGLVVCRFSLDMREDPTMIAELIRQYVETRGSDRWARDMVWRHLRRADKTSKDYLRLVTRVSEEMKCVPWKEYNRSCQLRYRDIPPSLRGSQDFILAFIPVDASVTSEVPEELRDDVELWQAAARRTPRYENVQVPAPSPSFPSKLFYLLLLEDAKGRFTKTPTRCTLPDAAVNDRDVALKYACLLSLKGEACWDGRIRDAFESDRDFWIELAEVHRCHVFAWRWVPEPIQADPSVVWAWARHANEMEASWLASRDPELIVTLLSDRQVLLNCLPPVWSDNFHMNREKNRQKIWNHIDPTAFDQPLWLELASRGEDDCFERLLPVEIKDTPAFVRARLRATLKDVDSFVDLFCLTLSLGVQLQHLDILLEVIKGMGGSEFFESHLYRLLDMGLLHTKEVALALLSKGWCSRHSRFREAVVSALWTDDPDFLILVVKHKWIPAFQGCYPPRLLADKDVVLKVLQLDSILWNLLDHVTDDGIVGRLKYDFDVLMSVLSSSPATILRRIPPLESTSRRDYSKCEFPTEKIVAFAREVRRRLTLYASIETVMMGTHSRARHVTDSTPLSLLDQDRYTKGAFRSRLTALLGAPSSDGVASLRRVSNALSRYGF